MGDIVEYTYSYNSPLGEMTLASNGEALTGIWFTRQKYYAATLGEEHEERLLPIFAETNRWLDLYFAGKEPDFTPALAPKGSDFRKRVWRILLTIPYGQVMTYGEIAQCIAKEMKLEKMSAQAVGGAVGHNPVSIIIPCHRVVGTNGSLTGYAGGINTKVELLKLEGLDMTQFTVPTKGTAI